MTRSVGLIYLDYWTQEQWAFGLALRQVEEQQLALPDAQLAAQPPQP